jgi:hypothetical protein
MHRGLNSAAVTLIPFPMCLPQDQFERVILNMYVKPDKPVVSYLTPLTGYVGGCSEKATAAAEALLPYSHIFSSLPSPCSLTKEMLDTQGMPLAQAVGILRQVLPPQAVLVGQNIAKDVEWLGLVEGRDFAGLQDLTGLYRVWNPRYKSFTVFGQDHLAKVLLDWNTGDQHDAVGDAVKSIRLFNMYRQLHGQPTVWQAQVEARLLATQPEPSFAKKNPSFEGVCMGNRRTCTCGAPFFG